MASASGVKAGEAYGELTLRDRMSKKLDAAKAKFMAFSRGMAVAGGTLMGVGGVVMGALAGPVRTFLELGGSMQDASDRTGVSAEELSALGYAAAQCDVSIEGLEKGLSGLAKLTLGVKQGTKASADTLDRLGISSTAFLAATPTGRLGMIADGLASIEDPGLRAALAMKALGKSGVALLPLMNGGAAGMQNLVDEAARMGVVLSSEDVAAADELGDSLGGLLLQVRALAFSVGAALAGPLMTAVQFLREAAVSAITFAKNNQQLVQWLAAGAVAVTVLGAVLLGLAGAGFVVAGAITAVTTIWAAAAAVLSFVMTPLFAIIAGITLLAALAIAGVAAWMAWTQSGQHAFSALANGFAFLLDVAKTTFGAIADAVMAGNWELAMKAAIAGLTVIWLDFKTVLIAHWQAFVGLFADSWIMLKGVVASALAALPAMLVGPFSTMQDYIVGWANKIASALGLEVRFDGIDALRQLSKDLTSEAGKNQARIAASTGVELAKAQAGRQAKVFAAGADTAAARVDLEKIRLEAAAGLADKVEKGRKKVTLGGGGAGGESPLVQPGGVLGTFSGAIAGMLSRSVPDIQQKIADNTERSADALEEIADQEGLVFE